MVEPAAVLIFSIVTAAVLWWANRSSNVSTLVNAMREGRFANMNQDEARAAFRRSIQSYEPHSGIYYIDDCRPAAHKGKSTKSTKGNNKGYSKHAPKPALKRAKTAKLKVVSRNPYDRRF